MAIVAARGDGGRRADSGEKGASPGGGSMEGGGAVVLESGAGSEPSGVAGGGRTAARMVGEVNTGSVRRR